MIYFPLCGATIERPTLHSVFIRDYGDHHTPYPVPGEDDLIGVVAEACILIPHTPKSAIMQLIQSPGIWGIVWGDTDEYLRAKAKEQWSDLVGILAQLGVKDGLPTFADFKETERPDHPRFALQWGSGTVPGTRGAYRTATMTRPNREAPDVDQDRYEEWRERWVRSQQGRADGFETFNAAAMKGNVTPEDAAAFRKSDEDFMIEQGKLMDELAEITGHDGNLINTDCGHAAFSCNCPHIRGRVRSEIC